MAEKGVMYSESRAYVVGRASVGVRVTLQNAGNEDARIDRLSLWGWYDLTTIAKSIISYGEDQDGFGWIELSDNPPKRTDVFVGMRTDTGRLITGGGLPAMVLLDKVDMFVNKTIPAGGVLTEEANLATMPMWLPYLKIEGRRRKIRRGDPSPTTPKGWAAFVLNYLKGRVKLNILERFGIKLVPNNDVVKLKFRAMIFVEGVPVLDTASEADIIGKPGIPGLRVAITPIVRAPRGVTTEAPAQT